jgi:hypothetical protein
MKFGEERSMDEPIDESSTPVPHTARAETNKKAKGKAKTKAKGGRRADQFCIYHRMDQADIPTLAIEYKAPHKLSWNDIVTDLREIEPDRDVIGKEGDEFSQLFSYMIGIGVRYGYICNGEAFIFLKITDDMEQVNDGHRTAVAQVLAFTLHSLAAKPPP